MQYLEFEKPIAEIEKRIEELRSMSKGSANNLLSKQIQQLENTLLSMRKDIYGNLTPWQRVQIARHPQRPYMMDYVERLIKDFTELHGDRKYGDDKALICGFGFFNDMPVAVIGHQKGRSLEDNIKRHFGCAHPEGYRKAIRVMELAAKRRIPIIVLIDTPGAYPGIGAEERGQAHAIAENLRAMFDLPSAILVYVIGEGGSGGALGIGVGDNIAVMENAYYSVISPEGCAAILWKDSKKADIAANVLKLTAKDLLEFKIIDEIVPEPLGGAHRDWDAAAKNLGQSLQKNLSALLDTPTDKLLERRYERFMFIGRFEVETNTDAFQTNTDTA